MKKSKLLSCTLLLLLAGAVLIVNEPAAGSDKVGGVLPGNPIVAAHVFESKKCVRCHLVDDQHEGYGPDLGRISLSNNMYDLVGRMWNSAPDMIAKMELIRVEFPTLEPIDLANLLAYLGVYQNYVVHYGRIADVENGKQLFQDRKCPSCHTFDPKANTAGPSLSRFRSSSSPLAVLRAMWLHSYYMRKAGVRMGIEWPKFSGGEINDLLAFIVSGDRNSDSPPEFLSPGSPQAGERLIATYDCNKCHSIKGKGENKAPDLGSILTDSKMDVYLILEAFWNHSPKMWETLKKKDKKTPQISTDDLADIVAYLFFVNFDRSGGDVKHGQELFDSRLCSTCHDPDLMVGDKMDFLSKFWNNLPEMLKQSQEQGLEWPTFSDGEVSSMVEYLKSVKDK